MSGDDEPADLGRWTPAGKAKSYLERSTVLAIWRDPAVSICSVRPLSRKTLITAASWKKGSFSEPMTPLTVVAGAAGLNFWATETRIAMITPTASSPASPSPIHLLIRGHCRPVSVKSG